MNKDPKVRMKKIFLSTEFANDKTAANKAKVDVLEIVKKEGYEVVFFPNLTSFGVMVKFWKELSKVAGKGTHFLLDFPCMPLKRIIFLYLFCIVRQTKLYGIIHDIGALRMGWSYHKDLVFLKMFDGLISHNAVMTTWLRERGYKKKIIDLEVFDYCLEQPKDFHADAASDPFRIFYAGNLSYHKATYLYDKKLNHLDNVDFCIYGQQLDVERMNGSKVIYKGVFNPNTPDLGQTYHFGLIWEGASLDTCSGLFGSYIRFNNPHKFSLYLSLGLPVIIWKEAALAAFVEKYNIGFTISSFDEIERISERITQEQYKEYIKNINSLAEKVRKGYFLTSAVNKLVNT